MSLQLSNLVVSIGGSYAGLASAFAGAQNVAEGFGGRLMGALGALTPLAVGMAGLVGVTSALGAVSKSIQLSAQFEQIKVALTTMLGSANAANAVFDDLKKFAASTPFEFPELASTAKQLIAFGVSTADLIPTMTKLGDVAAGVGATIGDIAAIYGKIKSLGKAGTEQLNQLAERGIPIWSVLAKVLNTDVAGVRKLSEEGKISADDINAAFTQMTGKGGAFAGMMQKQSQTLAGLWSTLQDSVTVALAGIGDSLVQKLDLKSWVAKTTGWLTTAGNWIVSWVGTLIDLAGAFWQWLSPILQTVWAGIVGVWDSIVASVSPIVETLWTIVVDRFWETVQSVIGFGLSMYNAFSAVLSAVYDIAMAILTPLWDGIVALFGWGTGTVTSSTSDAGNQIGTIFNGIVSVANWLRDAMTLVLNTIAWGLTHWQEIVAWVGLSVELVFVRLGNQIEYVLTEVIPPYLVWFGENWQNILLDVANLTDTVFTNLTANVIAIFSSLPDLIAGKVSFAELWTPLTDGFQSTLSELPKIAERQAGPLEKSLSDSVAGLQKGMGESLNEYLKKQNDKAKSATDGLKSSLGDLGQGLKYAAIQIPKPTADATAPQKPDTQPAQTTAAAATKRADAIVSESAASLRLQFGKATTKDNVPKQQLDQLKIQVGVLNKIADGLGDLKPRQPDTLLLSL